MARPTAVPAAGRDGLIDRRAFVAAAAAWGALAPLRAGAQTSAATLRTASTGVDDVAPVLWALHTGAFAKAGLNVSITRMDSGAAITAAVVGGSLDIGKSSLMPLINAHARKLPIAVVAPGEMWNSDAPVTGIITLKTATIATARDLNGKTMATAAIKDVSWLATCAWIDANGGDSKSVKFVEIPQYAQFDALLQGRVDAATLTNPSFADAQASGKVRVLGASDDGIAKHFMLTAWFASNDTLAKNAATVARFAQIVEASAAYTNLHQAETVAMVADFTKSDPVQLAHMTRGTCGTKLDAASIQPVIDAAFAYGVIDQRFDARDMLAKL